MVSLFSLICAKRIYSYVKENPLDTQNSEAATTVINRAVTVSAVKDGLCENLFDNSKILELDQSDIKDFYTNEKLLSLNNGYTFNFIHA